MRVPILQSSNVDEMVWGLVRMVCTMYTVKSAYFFIFMFNTERLLVHIFNLQLKEVLSPF